LETKLLKNQLRSKIKLRQADFVINDQMSFKIINTLLKFLNEFNCPFETLGLYVPLNEEPNIFLNDHLYHHCARERISWALPYKDIEKCDLKFVGLGLIEQKAMKDRKIFPEFKIENHQCVIPKVVVYPGLTFDLKGYRLGRGGGYYDKYFFNYPSVWKVGICYEQNMSEQLPFEEHDQMADILIGENVYKVLSARAKEFF